MSQIVPRASPQEVVVPSVEAQPRSIRLISGPIPHAATPLEILTIELQASLGWLVPRRGSTLRFRTWDEMDI
jgi:hypothetical protein